MVSFSCVLAPEGIIAFLPSGASKQKIKRIDQRKCNVGADQ